jgi:uncharacterized protein
VLRVNSKLTANTAVLESPTVQPDSPHLVMPAHHEVQASAVTARRLHGNLAAAADRGPKGFSELLLTPAVGARTVQALAMVAKVVHGTPCRFSDVSRSPIVAKPASLSRASEGL